MKKTLLALALTCLAFLSARADLIWYEGFNYADGSVITNSIITPGVLTNWNRHSGTANPSDAFVKNHKLENSATGGTLSRADDVHRDFFTFTNAQTLLYTSFTVNSVCVPHVPQ